MKIDSQVQTNTNTITFAKAKVKPDLSSTDEQDFKDELQFKNQEQVLELAIEKANKALEGADRHFEYEVHKPTNQVVITVVDNNTKEVIREIPPKKLLDLVAKLWELAGIIVDKKA